MPSTPKLINRIAITIEPCKPFITWVNKVSGENFTSGSFDSLSPVYLAPGAKNINQIAKWLSKNYDSIFADILTDWCDDESKWPLNRSLELFNKWFNITLILNVVDLAKTQIKKLKK